MGRWFAVAGGLTLVACGLSTDPRAASVEQGIVGGNVDTTAKYGSVFVVKIEHTGGPTAGCTGTLITARTLLTAAHCLPPDVTRVWTTNLTPAPASSPTFVESVDYRRHPSWTSADPAANDIGVILLPAPSTLKPYPYDRADLSTLVGKPLTAVGYGLTSPGATDNGTRRWVDLTFRAVTAAHIAIGNTVDKGVCFGDSGGPALHTFPDGVERVVGIHSYTQPSSNCTDGLDTRVDLYGSFIRTWLMDKEGGGTCLEDGLCKTGCTPADPDCVCLADGMCNGACANVLSDPDCPVDCAQNNVCTNLSCPNPDPDCTAELSPCTADTQCAARHCATDTQHNERYCARGCTQAADCLSGTACTNGVCLKTQKPEVAPGGVCVIATDYCVGPVSCLSVPSGGTRCSVACTSNAICPSPTTCSGGFCLGTDVIVAAPGQPCVQATTFCTGGTVCAGLAALGGTRCNPGCIKDSDCSGRKICQQGIGGVQYCENEVVLLPQLGVESFAGAKEGCSSAGGGLIPIALLLLARRRRP